MLSGRPNSPPMAGPPARKIQSPAIGGELGRPDKIYVKHIKSCTPRPQRIIIQSDEGGGVGWTVVPDNMDIILVGLVVGVYNCWIGARVIIFSLPNNGCRTTATGSTTTTGFEE